MQFKLDQANPLLKKHYCILKNKITQLPDVQSPALSSDMDGPFSLHICWKMHLFLPIYKVGLAFQMKSKISIFLLYIQSCLMDSFIIYGEEQAPTTVKIQPVLKQDYTGPYQQRKCITTRG